VPQDVATNKTPIITISHILQPLFKRAATHTHQSLIIFIYTLTKGKKKQHKGGEKREKAHGTRGTCTLIISIWTSGKIAHSLEVVKRWKAGVLSQGRPECF